MEGRQLQIVKKMHCQLWLFNLHPFHHLLLHNRSHYNLSMDNVITLLGMDARQVQPMLGLLQIQTLIINGGVMDSMEVAILALVKKANLVLPIISESTINVSLLVDTKEALMLFQAMLVVILRTMK